MAVAIRLPLVPPPVLPFPAPAARCFDPGRCVYQPRMIRYVRWLRGELDAVGEDAHEAMTSAVRPHRGFDELDRPRGILGPRVLALGAGAGTYLDPVNAGGPYG